LLGHGFAIPTQSLTHIWAGSVSQPKRRIPKNVKRNKKREDLQLFGTAIHGGAKTIIRKISLIMKKN
jgi:hypothetical protein